MKYDAVRLFLGWEEIAFLAKYEQYLKNPHKK